MIAIIGGTGLYQLDGIDVTHKEEVNTPFGAPSGALVFGTVGPNKVVFLPRHGRTHSLLPHEVNYRANIWALKRAGAHTLLSISAVGSLRQKLAPGHLVLVEQYIDMAMGVRKKTFFGEGIAAHISTATTAHIPLAIRIKAAAKSVGATMHMGKTYVGVEGPRLGTRAESFAWRNLGADVVGMTQIPEVFLAKEAQLAAQTIAVVTDYDCWKKDEHVTLEAVMTQYAKSIGKVQKTLMTFLSEPWTPQRDMHLAGSLFTPREAWPKGKEEMLDVLLA